MKREKKFYKEYKAAMKTIYFFSLFSFGVSILVSVIMVTKIGVPQILIALGCGVFTFGINYLLTGIPKKKQAKLLEKKTIFLEQNINKIINPEKHVDFDALYTEINFLTEQQQNMYLQIVKFYVNGEKKIINTEFASDLSYIIAKYPDGGKVIINVDDDEYEIIAKVLTDETIRVCKKYEIEDMDAFKEFLNKFFIEKK